MKRYFCIFTGQVQGVGFRWILREKAYSHNITGWVRNRLDGKVEAQLQGQQDAILNVINSLNNSYFVEVDDYQLKEIDLVEHEQAFEIID